jgi:hypothetical protein
MIESPVLEKWFRQREAAVIQSVILKKVETRFGAVPPDVSAALRVVTDLSRLESLLDAAYGSGSLDAFSGFLSRQAPATQEDCS